MAESPGPRAGRAVWLGSYALLTFLSFPHPVAGGVLDLGVGVAWLGPACLLLGLDGLAPGRAARAGFVASWLAHWAVLHWIYVVTVRYGHAHPVIGVMAPAGMAVYVAAHTALFAAVWSGLSTRLSSRWYAVLPWLAAALWTAADHLRSFSFTGFPWATLGYAQHQNGPLLGLSSLTGVYGLSFVTVLGGAALAVALRDLASGRRPGVPVGVALVGVLAAHGLGALVGSTAPADPAETLRVAVLQGNIDQGRKWSADRVDETLAIYADLTRRAAADGAEVVVWPETALAGAIGGDGRNAAWLSELARSVGTEMVVGAVGLEPPGPEGRVGYYDSAFLVDSTGALRDRYDKSHLVPFGEYVPFQDLLGHFLEAIARGIALTGVSAGAGPRPLLIEPEARGPLTAAVPICYELLFPDLVRRFVRDGAEILFAITNDAWYGRTGAPYQFLAITALRSAENRVWTARAANTGVSAIIDAGGRVRARTRIFERDLLVEDVPLRPAPTGGSFYSRHGDVFAGLCWLAVAVGAVAVWRRRGTA